jgi:hypothetical protein
MYPCSPSYKGGWGESISWTQEFEASLGKRENKDKKQNKTPNQHNLSYEHTKGKKNILTYTEKASKSHSWLLQLLSKLGRTISTWYKRIYRLDVKIETKEKKKSNFYHFYSVSYCR